MIEAPRFTGPTMGRRGRRWLGVAFTALLGACASLQPGRAIHIATASTSHTLCSSTFVSGQDPDQAYLEEMRPEAGMSLLDWALRYRVDRQRREVHTSVAGLFESHAVFRDGLGCLTVHGDLPSEPVGWAAEQPALQPGRDEFAGLAPVIAQDERIRAAIDAAFEEPGSGPLRHTKAVVVMHRGRIIAERYAPGIKVDTPMLGHSMTKSVLHALIGILVRQGHLSAFDRAPVAPWRSPGDPRAEITIDQLLRMSSGLPWDEYAGGWDDATRMWHRERDMYGFAIQAAVEATPGTRWNYSNRGYMVLSGILRDATGGRSEDVLRFAHRELFGPLGMRHVTLEFDAEGTPLGTSHLYASARDWARFGLLYLRDGVVGDRRILPEGWVSHAVSPTLDTGYGAGFWLNHVRTPNPMSGRWGMPEAPADAFFARGYLGQFIVVVPSQELVVVRLGVTHQRGGDVAGVGQLVGKISAAITTGR
ncbi:beta-lactamase family protein [Aquabacterium sp. A7-Y]|uniref:serine hydrolase domain-containing protein n=1 Tax=Aquabacterium sp. A7-Y TaxID=1349605 RepID=UPI00223D5459|nr:serine hydrolase [Aquabacterium sp. A7-Y]MCW7536809.1 beta-lactamase family protein [Aquabacterium sp. A7-Y]